ncbi:MAG: thiosulfate oxidation carrier complex protein SoxZ [Gammaproteobacteria bacterium]|nr:thiosulfate oxidation carrier complex protein SoxZ [Gammaproteobacteria bacterium]
MADSIKLKAKSKGGVTSVKALINHPMETGLRKDKKTGQVIPAHFIQEVACDLNGKRVMTAYWGGSVSKNPYLAFNVNGGAAGDKMTLSWTDNKGEKDSVEETVG